MRLYGSDRFGRDGFRVKPKMRSCGRIGCTAARMARIGRLLRHKARRMCLRQYVCVLVDRAFGFDRAWVCALDRAAFESGMVSVWIDEGSNILRRCFAGKDRLYCLRVRPRKPVFSDVVFACLIAYTFRRSLYRRCHMYAQTPSGKAECRRFDRLIGCGRRIKERIRLGKAQVGYGECRGSLFGIVPECGFGVGGHWGADRVFFVCFTGNNTGKTDRNQAILSLNMRG